MSISQGFNLFKAYGRTEEKSKNSMTLQKVHVCGTETCCSVMSHVNFVKPTFFFNFLEEHRRIRLFKQKSLDSMYAKGGAEDRYNFLLETQCLILPWCTITRRFWLGFETQTQCLLASKHKISLDFEMHTCTFLS